MAKYKIIDNDSDTYVVSKLDGKKYTRITHKHAKKHGMELSEYMDKFNLSKIDLISKQIHSKLGFTKKKAIEMYGEQHGLIKWNEYCRKQAETNTFEYKKEKYGMTESEFKQYNLSRSVTLENLIKRHGKQLGTKKWKDYCEAQAYSGCSIEYFKEKYGDVEGEEFYKNLCKRKAITLENMISIYGVDEGTKRYNSKMENTKSFFSSMSQDLFFEIAKNFNGNEIYYANINGGKEYGVYDSKQKKYYFYDYVDITLKRCIEFNGDVFHANPEMFTSTDTPNFYYKELTSEKIWEADKRKIDCLYEERGIDTFVVWERDYNSNKQDVIDRCIKFLKYGNANS